MGWSGGRKLRECADGRCREEEEEEEEDEEEEEEDDESGWGGRVRWGLMEAKVMAYGER